MVEIIIKTKVKASSIENAKKVGIIFNSVVKNVSEEDISTLVKELEKKPLLFKGIVGMLNNPIVKGLLR